MTWISLASNGLREINDDVFEGLSKLVYLDLSHNLIRSWPHFASACSSLTTLNLRYNKLGHAQNDPICLSALVDLDLCHNSLRTFPNFTETGRTLISLDMENNDLTEISDEDVQP